MFTKCLLDNLAAKCYFLKNKMVEKINFKQVPLSDSELHKTCLRCGRKLKTEDAKIRGYGPVCYEKILSNKQSLLFQKESADAKK